MMRAQATWSGLFTAAFRQSQNSMVLLDEERRHVDANGAYLRLLGHSLETLRGEPIYLFVRGGPVVSPGEWAEMLTAGERTGHTDMLASDGSTVSVQWAATVEKVTGHYFVLLVALSTSRWGRRFRRTIDPDTETAALTGRELEIVRLVALGHSGPEIANELHIAHDTVRTHVRNAMTKTGARSRAQLVATAIGDGLVLS
jgi:PAS domain S-box-containing protein